MNYSKRGMFKKIVDDDSADMYLISIQHREAPLNTKYILSADTIKCNERFLKRDL